MNFEPRGGRPAERLGSLDLLRFFAAVGVLFFHYGFRGTIGEMSQVLFPEFYDPARYGFWGVELFFVISGFVIAASAEARSAWDFAIARAGRIYPAFVVCVSLTALVIAFFGMPPYSVTWAQWLANLTFMAPVFHQPLMDGVYWTLALELIFYGWIALFLALGIYPKRVNWIVVGWLAICLLNSFYFQSRPLKFLLVTEYGPYFASGILMQRIFAGHKDWTTSGLFLLSVLVGFVHPWDFETTFPRLYGQPIQVEILYALHVGIYVVMGAALYFRKWLPSNRVVLALGGMTYPLYLLHENVGFIFLNRLAPVVGRWGALAGVVAGVLFVSWLIWKFLEPPGRRVLVTVLRRVGRSRK